MRYIFQFNKIEFLSSNDNTFIIRKIDILKKNLTWNMQGKINKYHRRTSVQLGIVKTNVLQLDKNCCIFNLNN